MHQFDVNILPEFFEGRVYRKISQICSSPQKVQYNFVCLQKQGFIGITVEDDEVKIAKGPILNGVYS